MFEAIPSTRGFINPLFEFIPGGLEGFPTTRRDTKPVPAPFAGLFARQAQRGHPYPQQQPAPQGQPIPNIPPYGPRGPQAQGCLPNPVFVPPVVNRHKIWSLGTKLLTLLERCVDQWLGGFRLLCTGNCTQNG